MKKIVPLLVFIFFISLSIGQQKANTKTEINFESANAKTKEKLSTLLAQYEFPKDYESVLELKIAEFEYAKQEFRLRYPDHVPLQKIDSLKTDFELWRSSQKQTIKNAQNLWYKTKTRFELKDGFKEDFVAYHFYIGIENPNVFIKKRIESASEKKTLGPLIKTMARYETRRIIALTSALAKLDSASVNVGAKALYEHLQKNVFESLENHQPLILKKETDNYKAFIVNAAKEKATARQVKNRSKINEALVNRAIDIGLDKTIADDILTLIEQRKRDLEALKSGATTSSGMASLFDNTDAKTKTEIKQEFAKKLAKLIDLKQFSSLFGSEFKEIKDQKTGEKMSLIQNRYDLNTEQVKEVQKMVDLYYYNYEIRTAYFSFDKKLRKQKLSALRYRFEKEYTELMTSYGIDADVENKVDNRSFQW